MITQKLDKIKIQSHPSEESKQIQKRLNEKLLLVRNIKWLQFLEQLLVMRL